MTDTAPAHQPSTGQKLAAEVLGTFVLVFVGCGTVVVSGDYVAIALAFGVAVLVMAYAVGHISGGHFNPAISVGFAMSGRMPWAQTLGFVAAQLGGALLAGLALFTVLHGFEGFDAEGNMGQNFYGDQSPGADFAMWAAFLVEMLTTALFLSVVLGITDKRNPSTVSAPIAIGLSLAGIHFATIGLTGTSVNPARSIGVGVFAGTDAILQLWLFILAPLLGAVLAGLAHPLVFGRDAAPVAGSGLSFSRPPAPVGYAGGWQPQPYQQPGWDPNATYQQQQAPAQWGPPQQQWDPNQQYYGQGYAEQQGWDPNQPAPPAQQPGPQQPGPQQWAEPGQGWQAPDPGQAPVDPGRPAGPWTDESTEPPDSRTQIRPPDGT